MNYGVSTGSEELRLGDAFKKHGGLSVHILGFLGNSFWDPEMGEEPVRNSQ